MSRHPAALRLDFHGEPARHRRRSLAAILVAVALVAGPVAYHRHLLQETAGIGRDTLALAAELAQPPRAAAPATMDAGSAKLLLQINVPWAQLLDGLEAAATDGTALLAMQPDARQGEVALEGEAAKYADVLAYIERLKAQPGFGQAYLTNHSVAEDVPGKPVRFTILLKWGGQG